MIEDRYGFIGAGRFTNNESSSSSRDLFDADNDKTQQNTIMK